MPPVKPVAPSCEKNKDPILGVLKQIISDRNRQLLEIGSGTGQHAVYIAPHFPHLRWVTSDIRSQHEGIRAWIDEAQLPNVHGPLDIEIGLSQIPKDTYDVVFSANVLHIISWQKCELLFQMLGRSLASGAQVIFYGPFNYHQQFTSESNAAFDQWLKSRDLVSGIRDFEEVDYLMQANQFTFKNDHEMPSNNRILHFQKL